MIRDKLRFPLLTRFEKGEARNAPNLRRSSARGASLVEVLVALGFVGVFAALVYSFSRSSLRSVQAQQARGDAQESTHLALDLIVRDLRQAGFNASGAPVLGIATARNSQIELRADWNGDGDFDDTNEAITYAADATRGTLTRALGSAPPQPVISHLVAESLRFTYFDAEGVALEAGVTGLDPTQRRAVRRVDVGFSVAIPSHNPSLPDPIRRDVATTVILRNVPPPS